MFFNNIISLFKNIIKLDVQCYINDSIVSEDSNPLNNLPEENTEIITNIHYSYSAPVSPNLNNFNLKVLNNKPFYSIPNSPRLINYSFEENRNVSGSPNCANSLNSDDYYSIGYPYSSIPASPAVSTSASTLDTCKNKKRSNNQEKERDKGIKKKKIDNNKNIGTNITISQRSKRNRRPPIDPYQAYLIKPVRNSRKYKRKNFKKS